MPGPIEDGSKGAPTGVAAIKSLVDNANTEDEKRGNGDDAGDGADADDTGDSADDSDDEEIPDEEEDDSDAGDQSDNSDDADDEDDSDDAGDSDDDSGKTTRRFTQFAGDGKAETYISNLEKGYQNSSTEAIRLKSEKDQADARVNAIMGVVASDADVAAKVNAALNGTGDKGDGAGSDAANAAKNPFISDAEARWTEKSDQEIDQFIEANPEVLTDPNTKKDVQKWMKVFSEQELKDTGKLMTGGEAMAKAYNHLGLENKLTKQNLAKGAKKTAAPVRSQGGKKKASAPSKTSFTSAQLEMAKRMGKDQAWLEKNSSNN